MQLHPVEQPRCRDIGQSYTRLNPFILDSENIKEIYHPDFELLLHDLVSFEILCNNRRQVLFPFLQMFLVCQGCFNFLKSLKRSLTISGNSLLLGCSRPGNFRLYCPTGVEWRKKPRSKTAYRVIKTVNAKTEGKENVGRCMSSASFSL